MSSLVPTSTVASEAAGGGAFEVDGWAEGPDFFFLGAMVDGVVKEEDGNEDDALRTLSGSHKRAPYLACQRCRGISAAAYGTGRPLAGSAGDVLLHKEQTSVGQHDRDHTGSSTQVRSAARRKTLLLLWWIDGGKVVVVCSTLAWQGRQWLRAYGCVGVQSSNPFYGCHGPPFID